MDFSIPKLDYSHTIYEKRVLTKKINAQQINDLINDLKRIDILNWNKQYLNSNLYFGTDWSIEIELSEEVITIVGIDDFPEQWDEFIKSLNKINEFSLT